MGSNSERSNAIQMAVQKLADTFQKDIVSIFVCNVDSVDEDARTCDCTPISGDATTQIPGVQLMAEVNDGMLLIPEVDSTVIVALSTRNTAFVLMYSDLNTAKIITSELTQFNDGSFNGLAKVQELTQKLNILEADLNVLKTAFSAWVVIPGDGGAALKTIALTWSGDMLTPTNVSDIENPRILHGI